MSVQLALIYIAKISDITRRCLRITRSTEQRARTCIGAIVFYLVHLSRAYDLFEIGIP